MGKLWIRNFLRPPPPQDRVKRFVPPPFKVRLRWFWVYLVKLRYSVIYHGIYHGILTSYISNERLIKIKTKIKKIVSSNVQS